MAVLRRSGQTMRRGNGTQAELANATQMAASGNTITLGQVAFRASVNCSSARRSCIAARKQGAAHVAEKDCDGLERSTHESVEGHEMPPGRDWFRRALWL